MRSSPPLSENRDGPTEVAPGSTLQFEAAIRAFGEIFQSYLKHPDKLIDAQFELWRMHARLWDSAWKRFLGEPVEPVVRPEAGDKRFLDPDWEQNQVFDFLKQSYLLTVRWAQDMVTGADVSDPHTKHKARFYVEQIANALAPSNFALTNPEVLKLTLATNGENLVEGMENLARDIAAGGGQLRIRQTDFGAFEVGSNLATTPGKVIFQNELMQLLQYAPATEMVYRRPLLIVPPWINKFYILDLNPRKSFIKWAVEQGFTVFVLSWVNPHEALAAKTFTDYMREGILEALAAIEKATGEKEVNAIGYCIGGTLLAGTLGYMAAKKDRRITSATFFASQVDFELAGDLRVFVDESQLKGVEHQMAERGYLEGKQMAQAFNMLRSNDLIWSYVVNNYLKGRDPLPFDLLYWNAELDAHAGGDPRLLSARVLSQQQPDQGPGGARRGPHRSQEGEDPDLQSRHPRGSHRAACLGVPHRRRAGQRLPAGGGGLRPYRRRGEPAGGAQISILDQRQGRTDPRCLARRATEHQGSWWPDWLTWVTKRSGGKVKARIPGDGALTPIEDAPGVVCEGEGGLSKRIASSE